MFRPLPGFLRCTKVALFGLLFVALSGIAIASPCTGPGAPTNTQTKCLTAIAIPGVKIASFDISFVNPTRDEYYLGDRSDKGVDIINTNTLQYVRTAGLDQPFRGIVLNGAGTAVNNNKSGPDGVTAHGRWLYAGDGNSTLHVIDLKATPGSETKQVISTGGLNRLDEMALTSDGTLLLAANNADDPAFVTLFRANGDEGVSSVAALWKITIDPAIMPIGFGLSLEQPSWDPKTKRFYTAIPIIANNPTGCNYGQLSGPITCSGGVLVTDPAAPTSVEGAYSSVTNTGVFAIPACGPNGSAVGVHDNILFGCTPGNLPGSTTQLIVNAMTHNFAQVGNITGSDEVYFNSGDDRYYTASSAAIKPATSPLGRGSVLGVIDSTSVLLERIPVSSGSHSVAADAEHNYIFSPQIFTGTGVPAGDSNTTAGTGSPTVGQLICGGTNGCIAVYIDTAAKKHKEGIEDRDERLDRGRDRDDDR